MKLSFLENITSSFRLTLDAKHWWLVGLHNYRLFFFLEVRAKSQNMPQQSGYFCHWLTIEGRPQTSGNEYPQENPFDKSHQEVIN